MLQRIKAWFSSKNSLNNDQFINVKFKCRQTGGGNKELNIRKNGCPSHHLYLILILLKAIFHIKIMKGYKLDTKMGFGGFDF